MPPYTREELNVGKLWPESFPPNSIFCVISVTAFKKVKGQSRNPTFFASPDIVSSITKTACHYYSSRISLHHGGLLGISMLFAFTVKRFTFLSAQIVLTFTQTMKKMYVHPGLCNLNRNTVTQTDKWSVKRAMNYNNFFTSCAAAEIGSDFVCLLYPLE